MAKHSVKDFTISRCKNENGGENVIVEIKTEIAKKFKYALSADTRQPSLKWIEDLLTKGLTYARDNFSKIDISEYLERDYVFIKFPKEAVKDFGFISTQFTARKVS
ncbi:hypothetical protein [Haemophilus sputorum]|uniref:Uncharacterized protein n=1 Tax=Haemophilus sputorum TaxID=1078480 RepID=A0ABX9HRN0_9PAST|nr:hypothetical protein [Haemophilus sputorum]RDF08380.1 hypothetical protein DPV80_05670 [Haemophilus sputorum]RDF10573.1 hypothetical protein DPV84_07835 [Haemophilus sputorum]